MGELYGAILRASNTAETAGAIAVAKEEEVRTLPLDTLEAVFGALENPPAGSNFAQAQRKLLAGLPGALQKNKASVSRLLQFHTQVSKLNLEGQVMMDRRSQTASELTELVAEQIGTAGLGTVGLPTVVNLCKTASPAALAAIVAALGAKAVEGPEVKELAVQLASLPPAQLGVLPKETLLRLAVAGAHSSVISDEVISATATAATATLASWSLDEISKLLLAVAKGKGVANNGAGGVEGLFSKASEVVRPQLASMSPIQLIKIILGVAGVPAGRPLLEAGAAEAVGRAKELPLAQLLLLTQGLAPLGASSPHIIALAGHWSTGLGNDDVQQLSADQLAKLASLLATLAPTNGEVWAALGRRLAETASSFTAAAIPPLDAAFPSGAGPDFEAKAKVLEALKDLRQAEERKKEAANREQDRDRERERDRDRDRRDRDRDDRGRRDRDRRSRSRGDRDRDRDRDRRR